MSKRAILLLALAMAPMIVVEGMMSGSVKMLSGSNFEKKVMKDDGLWIVAFVAPWCGHCKALKPEFEKAAGALKGVVNIGAVDATVKENEPLAGKYNVKGFPTIKVFGADKSKPSDYQGPRQAGGIVQESMKQVGEIIQSRMGGGRGGSGGSGGGGHSAGSSDAIDLTESSFKKKVLGGTDVWMVAFIAPWCGHCKKLLPEWMDAATELKGSVSLGVVDATQETGLAQTFGVRGYPTIKTFPGGPKNGPSSAIDYQGPRDKQGIVAAALAELDKTGVAPDIPEMVNQDIFDETCRGSKICVIAALPHILDSQKAGRLQYQETLAEVAKKFRGTPFNFLWYEGGAQPALEKATDLTFGFPAVVAVHSKKKVAIVQRGAFTLKAVGEFLNKVLGGRKQDAIRLNDIPKIKKAEPWDGEDASLPEEEPLDDIMGEDLDEM